MENPYLGTEDKPAIVQKHDRLTVHDFARFNHLHDDLGACIKNRLGPYCERKVQVVLFKPSGKYYTQEKWRVPEDAIGPYDMNKSPDWRTIDGGAVLIDPQENEAFGYPHLFNAATKEEPV